MTDIPAHRIRAVGQHDLRSDGDYVLYWLVANRRGTHDFSLQYAVEWAKKLAKPLVLFEPLWLDDPWATDRRHQFVLEGMVDNEKYFAEKPVTYYPYLEPEPGQGQGLIEALAKNACLVISDDSPYFFKPSVGGGGLGDFRSFRIGRFEWFITEEIERADVFLSLRFSPASTENST